MNSDGCTDVQLQEHLASELYWVPVSGSAGYWEAGCSSLKAVGNSSEISKQWNR